MPTLGRGTRHFVDDFDRAQTYTTTPGFNGWTLADTSAAGAPTALNINEAGGAAKLTMANTDEAEILTLYHGDVLTWALRDLEWFKIWIKAAGLDANSTLSWGMGSARNDTYDSVAALALFSILGSASTTAIRAESDDAVTDTAPVATGKSISSSVYSCCEIALPNGPSDVRFYIDGERVAPATTFDMRGYTGLLQPLIQIQKASGTGVGSVTIGRLEILGRVFNR